MSLSETIYFRSAQKIYAIYLSEEKVKLGGQPASPHLMMIGEQIVEQKDQIQFP